MSESSAKSDHLANPKQAARRSVTILLAAVAYVLVVATILTAVATFVSPYADPAVTGLELWP